MINNLEYYCSQCAQEIIDICQNNRDKDLENRITQALGVLQGDGFFAFYLFIKYRDLNKEKNNPNEKKWPVWQKLSALLKDENVGAPLPDDADDKAVLELTKDLYLLLLAKQLVERVLIYARYGIRSLPS
ncbi:MAG: hypothetical protein ACTSUK_11305 [Promethearchaeota archaeon]